MAKKLNEGEGKGWRPYTMDRELSVKRMEDMIIKDNAIERHPVEPGVPQRSPLSPILFAINTSDLIK
jgi:hypothetical protein